MIRLLLAGLLGAAAAITTAAPAQARPSVDPATSVEATMLVTGTLVIERDGTVSSHDVDKAGDVPDYVLDHIARTARQWRFDPVEVDGGIVRAEARMTLRMLATPLEGGDMAVSVAAATFGERYPTGSDHLSVVRMRPPQYPVYALERGASGAVYLLLKIGRDGRVEDAVAEQVNLRVSGDPATMETLRDRMSRAALKAARRWTFTPPTTGEHAGDPWWSARVPVEFTIPEIDRTEAESYGTWVAYVPGPRQTAPWVEEDSLAANDAIAAGTLQLAGTGYRLVTPLQPES